MSGPEHYQEAERLTGQVMDGAADWEPISASAQVHATLALAAATALGRLDAEAWADLAAERRPIVR